jgi:hypothetical protein
MNKYSNVISSILIFMGVLFLQGCTDHRQIEFDAQFKNAKSSLKSVDLQFDKITEMATSPTKMGKYERTLRVALETVKSELPNNKEIAKLSDTFLNDTTKNGSVYKAMLNRYKEFKSNPAYPVFKSGKSISYSYKRFNFQHFSSVKIAKSAITVDVYDEHFIDYINIVAGLSNKVQPVVISSVNKSSPIGSQLVGNENYGYWKKDASGNTSWSFLEAYAVMSILDSTMSRSQGGYNSSRRYRYDNWSNSRNWSYRNDVYMNKHASVGKSSKYNKFQSNLSSNKYKNSIKPNKTLKSQNTKMNKASSKYSSNLVKSNTRGSTRNGSTRNSSSTKAKQYSSSLRSSSKSARSTSRGK